MTQFFISQHHSDAAKVRELACYSRLSRNAALRGVMLDYLGDLLLPAFNEWRAADGIEPAPPRLGPPVSAEQAHAAAVELEAREALREGREPRSFGVKSRRRTIRTPPPEGLRTKAEAATRLACSIKTLNGYIASGAVRYVIIGHGKKRPRQMFKDADLNAFIEAQTRKDSPCPSTKSLARHTGTLISTGEVIDFRGPRRPAPSGRRKR